MKFGFLTGPVSDLGASDADLYDEVMEDVGVGVGLGFDSVWMLEHHFSNYYPTPSPLVFLAHVAARYPEIGLGTAVLVAPWYHPLRLAEEVAMLSLLSKGDLYLGLGRGTAKLEFDAYDVDMSATRQRFKETWEVVDLALKGAPFTYEGEHVNVRREVRLRPAPNRDRIHFNGAIGSPQSAGIMAELGLPPIAISSFPLHLQKSIVDAWRERTVALGRNPKRSIPLLVSCFMGDTDEEAEALARHYAPQYFRLQVEHYEVDADPWKELAGYQQFSNMFANLEKLANPENLGPWLELQLVGSAKTVSERIQAYSALGFDHFVLATATPGVPAEMRHDALRRFAQDVMPSFR